VQGQVREIAPHLCIGAGQFRLIGIILLKPDDFRSGGFVFGFDFHKIDTLCQRFKIKGEFT
jgi:hypothetical protein